MVRQFDKFTILNLPKDRTLKCKSCMNATPADFRLGILSQSPGSPDPGCFGLTIDSPIHGEIE